MTFAIEIEQEKDGRWIAEIPQIPGAMVYGQTREEAVSRVEALALRVLAERIEHGETSLVIEKVFQLQRHELMGARLGSQGSSGFAADWLDNQSALGGLAGRIEFWRVLAGRMSCRVRILPKEVAGNTCPGNLSR
jgi:predicted RNase H-like HicB family nuclease